MNEDAYRISISPAGCILSETSTRKATITEGFPGTIYLLPEGRFDRVFLRLFMERSDVGLNVKTITMKREDLPQSKKMQEIIVSIDSVSSSFQSSRNLYLWDILHTECMCVSL